MPRLKFGRLALSAVPLVLLLAGSAPAQPQPPGGVPARPTFSPYLSLVNRGASPALNYFGFVRPQQQAHQQAGQLQQQLNNFDAEFQSLQLRNQQIAGGILEALLPSTGNVATFNNTGGYFNRIGGGTAGSFGGGRPGGASGIQPSFARPSAGGSAPRTPFGGGAGGIRR